MSYRDILEGVSEDALRSLERIRRVQPCEESDLHQADRTLFRELQRRGFVMKKQSMKLTARKYMRKGFMPPEVAQEIWLTAQGENALRLWVERKRDGRRE